MENEQLVSLMDQSIFGYARHRIMTDESGRPVDYIFLEVNKNFCDLTGIDGLKITNRRVTEIIPTIRNDELDWIGFYGKIALEGGSETVEHYSRSLKKWFLVQVSSGGDGEFTTLFLDITERKEMELALERSEKRYRALFENINEGVALHEIITDDKGKPVDFIFLEVNRKYEELTGLKAEEIIGRRVKEVIPEIGDKWVERYGNVALTGEPLSIVDHSLFHDRYWDVRAFSPGKHLFAVSINDITGRRNSEVKSKESEERLKQLSDLTFEGIVIHNMGIVKDINGTLSRMTGYTREELIGKNIIECCVPEDQRSIVMENVIRECTRPYRILGLKKDGTRFPVEIQGRNVVLDGSVVRVTAIRDISDKARAEEALLHSEEQFSKAFQSGPLLMTISSLEDGRYIEINDNFSRVTGFERDETIGRTSTEMGFISVDDRENLKRTLLDEGRVSGLELELTKKNGSKFNCLFFGEMIKVSGEKRLLSIAEDITERKKAEKELKDYDMRLRVERDKADFYLDLFHHDIGNVHQGIFGSLQIMDMKLDEAQRDMKASMEIAMDSLQKAITLTRNVKIFSMGKSEDEPLESIKLSDTIIEARDEISNTFNNRQITWDLELIEDEIMARPVVKQVFFNLFHNAVKVQKDQNPWIGVRMTRSVEGIRIDVCDMGPGVPDVRKYELFDSSGIKGGKKRTGLGLMIIKDLVTRYNGEVEVGDRVHGKPEEGARFILRFLLKQSFSR